MKEMSLNFWKLHFLKELGQNMTTNQTEMRTETLLALLSLFIFNIVQHKEVVGISHEN